ncbi:MarR family winged helix-turn-helix transcriptional regulator [Haliangium sp.]|uniref:MarR family winged helix-turn-helix transcriptional regulator n=1 Tax=Haliangium sp. TaxID=2663208 RepID=UPI003D0BF0DE
MPRAVELFYAISELSDALSEKMKAVADQSELTTAQFNLLYIIEEEGPMRLSELARNRRCVKSNVSNLVRGMESTGLVRLTPEPHDRRVRIVHPTTLGRRRFRAALRDSSRLERALRESLGEASAAELTKLSLAAAAFLDELSLTE